MVSGAVQAAIVEAMEGFDRDRARSFHDEAEHQRSLVIERFPLGEWPDMPLERYALGQGSSKEDTFCWWMEFGTKSLGSIKGGSSNKHLIFRRRDGAWRFPPEHDSLEEAWAAVRQGFVTSFDLAASRRFDEISGVDALKGASALRAKSLLAYFPDDFLPIYSKAHLDHFLKRIGEEANDWSTVGANRRLLQSLRAVPELEDLSQHEIVRFLYSWADPRSAVRVVKIAPGESANRWAPCLDGEFICVGWSDVGDLTQYSTKEEFREAFREHYPYNGNESAVTKKANELWWLMDLEPGDKVVANRGISEVLAVGTVNDEGYAFRPELDDLPHTIGVDWDTSVAKTIPAEKSWATTTVKKLSGELYRRILGGSPASAEVKPVEIDRIHLQIEEAIQRRGQVILYGPPGTGKTYSARRAAVWLLLGGQEDPQAAAVLGDRERFREAERALSMPASSGQASWVMVASPGKDWRWDRLFEDGFVTYSHGRLRRNFPNVKVGDLVFGYESTPTLRFVAIARVTSEYDPSAPDDSLALEPVTKVANGLTYAELQADEILAGSEPVRMRFQGTLFKLEQSESEHLLRRLTERDPLLGDVSAPAHPRLTRVTFHPSFTYEDFIEGYRPQRSAGQGLDLALADGIFKQVCLRAASDPDRPYVLLIDEINRGNVPKIFGELITLIEKDKRGLTIRLPQSGTDLAVPDNLWIIGSMNTADRSIHLLDAALRRRFAFVELMPDSEVLAGATIGPLALDQFLDALNARVRERFGREKQIGHALLFDGEEVVQSPEAFAAIFRHELLPLLQEYVYEDYTELADLLGSHVIDVGEERPVDSTLDDPEALCLALADHLGATSA